MTPEKYKRCLIARAGKTDTGKHLYEITGRLSKPADSPPILTSRQSARDWIKECDQRLPWHKEDPAS